jgi:hypothetical protein
MVSNPSSATTKEAVFIERYPIELPLRQGDAFTTHEGKTSRPLDRKDLQAALLAEYNLIDCTNLSA